MKVIDLLNKIANGEELPKKISINDYKVYDEYTIWTFEDGCYNRNIKGEERQFLFEYLTTNMLNDEVDEIEDTPKEDKKIEKLDLQYKDIIYNPNFKANILMYCDNLQFKINEIIDKVNGK